MLVWVTLANDGRPARVTVSGLPSASTALNGISSTAPRCTVAALIAPMLGARLALFTTIGNTRVVVRGVPVPLPSSVAITVIG